MQTNITSSHFKVIHCCCCCCCHFAQIMSFDQFLKVAKFMHYIFSSLLVIRMTPLIPFNWLSWFKFIYFQLIIISGRIQETAYFAREKNSTFDYFLLFFYAREHLNLPFSFASLLSRANCQDPPIIIHLPKHFHVISPVCTLPELQNQPI